MTGLVITMYAGSLMCISTHHMLSSALLLQRPFMRSGNDGSGCVAVCQAGFQWLYGGSQGLQVENIAKLVDHCKTG